MMLDQLMKKVQKHKSVTKVISISEELVRKNFPDNGGYLHSIINMTVKVNDHYVADILSNEGTLESYLYDLEKKYLPLGTKIKCKIRMKGE